MPDCSTCKLRGRKCFAARTSGRIAALSIYGLVLSLIGGAIIWACISSGISEDKAILVSMIYLSLELGLFLRGGKYAPGLLITAVLFGSLIQWITRHASYSPISETGRQIIRDAILTRNTAV